MSDTELASGLVENHPAAFAYLYERYGRVLLKHIKGVIPDHGLAEDVLQNVFMKIHLHASSYNPQKGRLFSWLMTVARNECLDTVRSKTYRDQVRLTGGLTPACFKHAQNPYQMVDTGEIRRVVHRLPLELRNPVALSYFYGFSHREIAVLLRLPLGTVKTNIRRAYRCLQALLEAAPSA